MKRDPRFQHLGDIPQVYRPEVTEDAYGVDAGGGYSNAQILDTQQRIEQVRQEEAEAIARIGPYRNVAMRARFAQSAFAITEVSLQVLRANPRRNYLLIQNIGANDVFINFANKAQVNNVKIIANGNYEPYVCPLDSVNLICGTGLTSTITVIEGVETRQGGY